MLTTRDEGEGKLPKWARDELARLRKNLLDAQSTIGALTSPGSRTRVGYWHTDDFGIPEKDVIRFDMGGDGAVGSAITVQCDYDQRLLRIRGGGPLVILPEVTNCIGVRLEP